MTDTKRVEADYAVFALGMSTADGVIHDLTHERDTARSEEHHWYVEFLRAERKTRINRLWWFAAGFITAVLLVAIARAL